MCHSLASSTRPGFWDCVGLFGLRDPGFQACTFVCVRVLRYVGCGNPRIIMNGARDMFAWTLPAMLGQFCFQMSELRAHKFGMRTISKEMVLEWNIGRA